MSAPADDLSTPTLLLTLTGEDRPGVTRSLFDGLAEVDATVLDVEQVVVRGRLTLAVLVACDHGLERPRQVARAVATRLGMDIETREGLGDNASRSRGRAAVVVMGQPLTAAAFSTVANRIAAQGANIDRIRRLSRYPLTTVELDLSGADVPTLRRALSLVASEQRVDIAVAPAGLARRGRLLLVMDVDSTFIQQEVIELLAAHAGREAEVAAVTERAMRGELDFAESLRERVATLASLPETVLHDVRAAVRLTPGARTLVRTLKRLGFTVALVSGGFIEIVQPIADELGIDHVRANRLEVVDGRLTGRVVGEIVDRAGKERALREIAASENLPTSRTVAIGDGANDLDMLQAAGLGIAFNAKTIVREQADATVNVPFLDAVLFLLGITREEVEDADEQAAT